jgi:hypothetical protein
MTTIRLEAVICFLLVHGFTHVGREGSACTLMVMCLAKRGNRDGVGCHVPCLATLLLFRAL